MTSQAYPQSAQDRYLRTPLASFPFDLQARMINASSIQDIYEIGVAILARIPATISVRIFQRDDNGEMVLVHAWQSPMADMNTVSAAELGQAVYQRWITAHRVGHSTVEFARPFTHPDHPTWLITPMLASDELIGAIVAERRDGETFPYAPEDIVAFAAVAAGMSWGIHSIFMRDRTGRLRVQESREEIAAQERREIGRELHDNVVQNLAYINMKLEIVERYAEQDPDIVKNELQGVRDLVNHSITELRQTIGEMRRPAPSQRGITGQLRSLATTIAIDASELEMDLKEISGVQLVPEVERAVVGIVREALQNVRKHAQANSVKLEVARDEDELQVFVSDDGVGINSQSQAELVDHFGMVQMQELAEDLGGELRVNSLGERGTSIEARLPLVMPARASSKKTGSSGLSASEYLSQPPPSPDQEAFASQSDTFDGNEERTDRNE